MDLIHSPGSEKRSAIREALIAGDQAALGLALAMEDGE